MRGGFSIENQSVSFPSFALQLFLLLDHHSDGQLSRRFLAGSSMCWRNVRGDPVDQERTIARAIGASVNYFDTAVRKKKPRFARPFSFEEQGSDRSSGLFVAM
jgi:hypothetical protein